MLKGHIVPYKTPRRSVYRPGRFRLIVRRPMPAFQRAGFTASLSKKHGVITKLDQDICLFASIDLIISVLVFEYHQKNALKPFFLNLALIASLGRALAFASLTRGTGKQ